MALGFSSFFKGSGRSSTRFRRTNSAAAQQRKATRLQAERAAQSKAATASRTEAAQLRDEQIRQLRESLGLRTQDLGSADAFLKALGGDASGRPSSLDTSALSAVGLAKAKFELDRRKREAQEASGRETRGKQRETATKTAMLQRQALKIQDEGRKKGLSRQLSGLRRQARQERARILSGASAGGTLRTSAFRASRIAIKSSVTREQEFARSTAKRAQEVSVLKEKEIAGTLESTLFTAREPEQVFLSQSDIDMFASESGTGGTIFKSTLTGSI